MVVGDRRIIIEKMRENQHRECAWKEVLSASDEEVKERCKLSENKRERLKGVYIGAKRN